MKKSIILFVLFLIIFHGNFLFAHDDVVIHPKITENAIKTNIIVEDYLKNNLNFKEGFETILSSNGGKTIMTWLKNGSMAEDSPMCRASNHFHDPTKPWTSAAMSDSPWWLDYLACRSSIPYHYTVTWTTGYASPTATPIPYDVRNSHSPNMWANARKLYYNALTATDKNSRENSFAQMFKAL